MLNSILLRLAAQVNESMPRIGTVHMIFMCLLPLRIHTKPTDKFNYSQNHKRCSKNLFLAIQFVVLANCVHIYPHILPACVETPQK